MNKKRWLALVIFVAILALSSLVQLTTGAIKLSSDKQWNEEIYQQGGLDRIALLEVEGVITSVQETSGLFTSKGYNHELFLKQLKEAFGNEQIKGIVLKVNSPGGGVVESDEIYHTIRQLKAEYEKPIVVYMANTAASGGYYISALADKIYATRSTITGSIGVIISSINVKELADEWGIRDQTFTSGPHKDILSPLKEVTEEEREIIQGIVDEMYDNFVDVVAEGRKLPREKVLELADGRIYTGSQAKELGLIDELGFLDDAIKGVAELAKVEEPTVIRYKQSGWGAFAFMSKLHLASSDMALANYTSLPHHLSFMYLLPW